MAEGSVANSAFSLVLLELDRIFYSIPVSLLRLVYMLLERVVQ